MSLKIQEKTCRYFLKIPIVATVYYFQNEGSQVIKFVPSNKVFLVYVYKKEFKLTHTNLYIKMVKLGRNENSLVL